MAPLDSVCLVVGSRAPESLASWLHTPPLYRVTSFAVMGPCLHKTRPFFFTPLPVSWQDFCVFPHFEN